VSIEAARGIAERAHRAQIDADGEPYIAHVGRVTAGVPLFARPVGWLHDVLECSNVEEAMFVAAGASPDQCMALRLLARDRRRAVAGQSRRVRGARDPTCSPQCAA
jgi:hypothetical protein